MEEVAMENQEVKALNCSLLILPNNTLCIEDPEEMLLPWKAHPFFFEIIFLHAIIFVFGVLGNLMVIAVMAGDRKSRNATNFFLVSLAVGDLLMLCVYGPLETYTHFVIKWDENGAICRTAQLAEMVSATSSVLNLLAVTVERFIVIVFPMKSQIFCTFSNMVKAVLSVWVLSLLLAVPVVFTTYTYKMTFTNNVTTLTLNYCSRSDDSPNFVVYQFFIIFCVPSITMTICYSFVIRELWTSTKKMNLLTNGVSFRNKSSRNQLSLKKKIFEKKKEVEGYAMVDMKIPEKKFHNNNRSVLSRSIKRPLQNCQQGSSREAFLNENYSSTNNEVNQARKQVIKMLILVIILFYVCWGPRVSMDVLQKYELVKFNNKAYTMRITFNIMTFFHACINPFIYSFMSKNFRSRLIRYLEKWGLKKKSKWPRRCNQTISGSVKSYPKYYNGRSDFDEKKGRSRQVFAQGSFMSCETKISEMDSIVPHHSVGNSC